MKDGLKKLFITFKSKDCTMVEINPVLVDSKTFAVHFADSKINIDDAAMFRQPQVQTLYNEQSKLYETKNNSEPKGDFNYVKLDGNIGCLGTGLEIIKILNLITSHVKHHLENLKCNFKLVFLWILVCCIV